MKKIIVVCLLLGVLSAGCAPTTFPNVEKWDTTTFPADVTWISPPKTWVGKYEAGDSETFTLLLHAPAYHSIIKRVNTTTTAMGEDGILHQYMDIPILDASLGNVKSIDSEHRGDRLEPISCDDGMLVISGFDPIEISRVIRVVYIPEYFEFRMHWKEPSYPDSGKELLNPPSFSKVTESANWITFAAGDFIASSSGEFPVKLASNEVLEVQVTLDTPKDAVLPEYWEFWIGAGDATGESFVGNIIVGVEHVYKVLVSRHAFKFIEE